MAPNRNFGKNMNDEQDEEATFHECHDAAKARSGKGLNDNDNDNEDSEEAYRNCIYVTTDKHDKGLKGNSGGSRSKKMRTPSRRLVTRLSQRFNKEMLRRRTSFIQALPETPTGWAVLVSAMSSLCLGYELSLQKSLTAPPRVYGQIADRTMKLIYDKLTASPESILRRPIQPSLFVGTRGVIGSTAAYLGGGPGNSEGFINFREVVTMSQDGARIALDWELPPSGTPQADKDATLNGPLKKHVVLILHGINNDANFGYMKALMRACTMRGWAAVGMNFRGCGGLELSTPRGYNGAHTGDIRGIVHILDGRMDGTSLFIVGNSLGANLITKYLGEEGRGGTLPKVVAGGISLGNPLHLHSGHLQFPWGHILSLGARKTVLEHLLTMRKMTSPYYQSRINKCLMASTLGEFDEALAPIFISNNTFPPYEPKIGYENAETYWRDASSYLYIRYISVPLLQLTSEDDFLVSPSSTRKLNFSISNPNVMVVNTRCGGHLGWQECPPDTGSHFGFGTSWADAATTDFIAAVLEGRAAADESQVEKARQGVLESAKSQAARLKSRL